MFWSGVDALASLRRSKRFWLEHEAGPLSRGGGSYFLVPDQPPGLQQSTPPFPQATEDRPAKVKRLGMRVGTLNPANRRLTL